jgi:hypothetical protein
MPCSNKRPLLITNLQNALLERDIVCDAERMAQFQSDPDFTPVQSYGAFVSRPSVMFPAELKWNTGWPSVS